MFVKKILSSIDYIYTLMSDKQKNYYLEAMSFVLDLVRKLMPKYDNTSIMFAPEELPIYRQIQSELSVTFAASISADHILNIGWGTGKHPTKNVFSTPFYDLSMKVKDTKDRIDMCLKGVKPELSDRSNEL